MILVPIDDIIVSENRQRTSPDDERIAELAQDILKPHGLLQPLVLQNDCVTLVCGERRLRALSKIAAQEKSIVFQDRALSSGVAPCVTLGELSQDELFEAELSENIRRVNLSWQEISMARGTLAKMRREQSPNLTQREVDTATVAEIESKPIQDVPVDAARRAVHDDILLADNMHRPAVATAKNRSQAIRHLLREQEAELALALAKRFGPGAGQSRHELIQGDAGEVMAEMPSNTFDCIIADPPYGIGADAFGEQAGTPHYYEDSPERWLKLIRNIAHKGFNICKAQAHAYIFCDFRTWDKLKGEFSLYDWDVWPQPLIWFKGTSGHLPRPDHGPRRTYECILYASKGDRMTTGVFLDVINEPAVVDAKVHAAQKPVALYEDLIRRTCRPEDSVLDPCCGSGTIFPAAARQSVRATGIELDPVYHAAALARLNPTQGEEEL